MYGGGRNTTKSEKVDIVVEDDVWIGFDCIIMPGSRIGKGSVIGARSIVKGNIPPYSVYVHNKVIKPRFTEEIIEKIKDIDFHQIRHQKGDSYHKFCNTELTIENVDEIVKAFKE